MGLAFVACLIAWPLTSVTVFASEPFGILQLSWAAFTWEVWNGKQAAQIRCKQEE